MYVFIVCSRQSTISTLGKTQLTSTNGQQLNGNGCLVCEDTLSTTLSCTHTICIQQLHSSGISNSTASSVLTCIGHCRVAMVMNHPPFMEKGKVIVYEMESLG